MAGASAEKANVLLVSIDTVRADHLGCFGYSRDTSPTLDRLAKEGVLFRRAYSQAPWTLPSHISVFTGQYPSTHGVNDISKSLAPSKFTLAKILKMNGYDTVALVNNGNLMKHWGCDRGFDVWTEFNAVRPEGACENITAQAIEWLSKRAKEQPKTPFLLFLHYFDPHDPYNPPEPYRSMFAGDYVGAIHPDATAELLYQFRPLDRNFESKADLDFLKALYDGEIRYLDDSLRKLLDSVKALGFDQNTVVIVFSDHGEEFEEHLSTTHGATLYDELLHVPFIIRSPFGVKAGSEVEEQVELLDILPTLLEMLGLAPFPGAEGMSRLDAMKGHATNRFRWARAETLRVMEGLWLKSLRTPAFKYVYSQLDGRELVFDLKADKGEQKNLPEVKTELLSFFRKEMERWLDSSEDYWRVRVPAGPEAEAIIGTLKPAQGRFGAVFPVALDEADEFFVSPEWDAIRFRIRPGNTEKGIYLEILDRGALVAEFPAEEAKIGGADSAKELPKGKHVVGPAELLMRPFNVAADWGLPSGKEPVIQHFRGQQKPSTMGTTKAELDEATKEMLRTLGYIQ